MSMPLPKKQMIEALAEAHSAAKRAQSEDLGTILFIDPNDDMTATLRPLPSAFFSGGSLEHNPRFKQTKRLEHLLSQLLASRTMDHVGDEIRLRYKMTSTEVLFLNGTMFNDRTINRWELTTSLPTMCRALTVARLLLIWEAWRKRISIYTRDRAALLEASDGTPIKERGLCISASGSIEFLDGDRTITINHAFPF